MEIEELKTAWKSANGRLDEMQTMQGAMQKVILRDQTKKATRWLGFEPVCELVLAGIMVIWAGGFLFDNLSRVQLAPVGALPALVLFALSVFTIWVDVRQLIVVSELDYGQPVAETQRKIAFLKTLRVRSTQAMLLIGIPLWFVFPLFLIQSVAGYGLVQAIGGKWLLANLAFGALFSAAVIAAARKFGEQSPFFRVINGALAGTEIAKAQKLLAEVKEFERPS
jgi:hypothetical protein